MQKTIVSILLSGLWITFSEFIRNEILFKSFWISHFDVLGLTFQTLPVNGILWTVWSFGLAVTVFALLRKFSVKETVLITWIPAFLMMWISLYNLQVLPLVLLIGAIPLSVLEIYIAIIIIRRYTK